MTLYPTFNWRDFALRLARAIAEGDADGMEDGAKDALLYEDIPCPSITIGGPNGGKPTCCNKEVPRLGEAEIRRRIREGICLSRTIMRAEWYASEPMHRPDGTCCNPARAT